MLADFLYDTLRNLRAHKLRFGLTASGIVWGIMMLTYLSAWMNGFDVHLTQQMLKIGQNVVYLFPGVTAKAGIGERAAKPVELDFEDVARLEALDVVERAGTNQFLDTLMVRARGRTKLVWSYGVTEKTGAIRNFEVGQGRFISRADVEGGARVAFLGARTAERLFGGRSAVGERITIEAIPFRVVGVAAMKGEQIIFSGPPDDNLVLMPITTARRWFSKTDTVGQIIFEPRSRESGAEAMVAVRGLLGVHHGFHEDDSSAMANFWIVESLQIIEVLLLGFQIFLYFAIGVTLLVGAAGVMNVMFVIVTERTREIGLRKAIGGSNLSIFAQFLVESVATTAFSGALGAVLGVLMVELSQWAIGQGTVFISAPVLAPGSLVTIVVVMVATGIGAGILPAIRAARIEPAVSLRSS